MTNLLATIAPKSDQLNADDLIGRNIDIKVSKVSLCGEPDQPIAVHYEGDGGKPYKPCKSMRRVMVHVWGGDGAKFAGRRMRLYRDDKVQFGGLAVGGIRISHMSDIDRDVTMALTATRANRKPYTVKPLPSETGEPTEMVDLLSVLTAGRAEAAKGSAALSAWWQRLDRDEKAAAKPTLDSELKGTASKADQAALDDTTQISDDPASPSEPSETPASETRETSDAGDQFPGDAVPDVREGEAADPSEADVADEEKGSAADLLSWHQKFIDDLPALTAEQIDLIASRPDEQAKFAALKDAQPQLTMDLEKAIVARKRELAR